MDEAILGGYLVGANTRRIRKALMPLLGEEQLSKSALSRVASRPKDLFRRRSGRDKPSSRQAALTLPSSSARWKASRRRVCTHAGFSRR